MWSDSGDGGSVTCTGVGLEGGACQPRGRAHQAVHADQGARAVLEQTEARDGDPLPGTPR